MTARILAKVKYVYIYTITYVCAKDFADLCLLALYFAQVNVPGPEIDCADLQVSK